MRTAAARDGCPVVPFSTLFAPLAVLDDPCSFDLEPDDNDAGMTIKSNV